MVHAIRELGDKMLERLLPKEAASASHCCWINAYCFKNETTGCASCIYDPNPNPCGCSGHIASPCF